MIVRLSDSSPLSRVTRHLYQPNPIRKPPLATSPTLNDLHLACVTVTSDGGKWGVTTSLATNHSGVITVGRTLVSTASGVVSAGAGSLGVPSWAYVNVSRVALSLWTAPDAVPLLARLSFGAA